MPQILNDHQRDRIEAGIEYATQGIGFMRNAVDHKDVESVGYARAQIQKAMNCLIAIKIEFEVGEPI